MNSYFSLDFRVKECLDEEFFDYVKKYQELGVAGRDCCIVLNDVRIPVGCLSDFSQCMNIYNAICSGDIASIKSILSSISDISEYELLQIFQIVYTGMVESKRINPNEISIAEFSIKNTKEILDILTENNDKVDEKQSLK